MKVVMRVLRDELIMLIDAIKHETVELVAN